jgi:glycosyltransferase involved in cell wall biosynthesis
MSGICDVSVVIPCLDEEETVGSCIRKVAAFFKKNNLKGEILVVDNGSADSSARIAHNEGARVIMEPARGYGAAYLRGFREANGRYIAMADADDTYDLAQIGDFLKPLQQGYDMVIGSRFKGKMHRGAMPWANRYIGNPILTGLYKLFFKTDLTDIHCGMRSFTRQAYQRLNLHCLGMEFASEMMLEALRKKIKIKEIPIEYYPRKGSSKLRPIKDAWRHLRFMLLFCPAWLYLIPGVCIATGGFLLTVFFGYRAY